MADGMNGLRKDIRHGVEVLGRGYQNPPPVASFFDSGKDWFVT